ncbi:GHMP family kinase ATP-binding protein [Streptomyces cyaneofuscatus]
MERETGTRDSTVRERCAAGLPRRPGGIGVGTAFGTFGELLQGALPERDGDFLVTLPVERNTVATFRPGPAGGGLRVDPPHKGKALRLAGMVLAELGEEPSGFLSIESALPEGKGMASSSADLVATARAVTGALGAELSCRRLETMLARIEPTDGVLYPGVVAFHHCSVRLRQRMASPPPMTVVAVDEGGQIDTVAFNRIPKPFTTRQHVEYARLLDELSQALEEGDAVTVGAIATRSAALNQALNPKLTLEPMIRLCSEYGGLGVVNAHSGTTLGILLLDSAPDHAVRLEALTRVCRELTGSVAVHRVLTFDAAPDHPRWSTV